MSPHAITTGHPIVTTHPNHHHHPHARATQTRRLLDKFDRDVRDAHTDGEGRERRLADALKAEK